MKKRIKPKKQNPNTKRAFKKLEEKTKRSMGKAFRGAVYDAPGEIKMSEALENLIEPYTEEVGTIEAMRKLVALGGLAWNLALLPSEVVAKELPKLIKGMAVEPGNAQMLIEVIQKMIERKLLLYPDVNRYIVNSQVEDLGDGWHISVASTFSSPNQ